MPPDALPALTPISQPELSHSYAIHVGSMLGVSLLKSFWGHTWACWRAGQSSQPHQEANWQPQIFREKG